MEDASAVDLDWFWRGWFYTTDNVDISLEKVSWYKANTTNPEVEKPLQKEKDLDVKRSITTMRNEASRANTMVEMDPSTKDFYNSYDEYVITSYSIHYTKLYEGYCNQHNDGCNFPGHLNFY